MTMSDFRKNFIVGLTMLLGLGLLATMIILFGKGPARLFGPNRINVTFLAPRADGLSEGSEVRYLGKDVGNVQSVDLDPLDQRRVIVRAVVNRIPPLPGNVIGKIRTQLVGGGSTLDLEVMDHNAKGEVLLHPVPEGQLQADQQLKTDFVGVDVLPPEIGELAAELRTTVLELRKSNLVGNTNELVKEITVDAQRVGKLVDSLNANLGDPKVEEDFKTSMANIRSVTDHATRASENLEKFTAGLDPIAHKVEGVADHASATLSKAQSDIDQITQKVDDRLVQAAKLLQSVQSIAEKIDHGQGTAGLLINDPKLYQEMAGAAQELKGTIADLRLLIQQWTQEGVSMKLNDKK
jgi:phospholipid/cholesterol/gamma-HCH transport system substrate-binding protein